MSLNGTDPSSDIHITFSSSSTNKNIRWEVGGFFRGGIILEQVKAELSVSILKLFCEETILFGVKLINLFDRTTLCL